MAIERRFMRQSLRRRAARINGPRWNWGVTGRLAAICNLITAWIQTTPEAQHARNHARADRILTFIEEKVFGLSPLPSEES